MKKYIALSIILYLLFIIFTYLSYCYLDFEKIKKILDITSPLIQSLAIIIGGFWAYKKFGWEKKCENIISLKASLMEYSYRHNLSAAKYRMDNDIVGYKTRLLPHYQELSSKIHLSYFVGAKVREKIFNAIWLTIGNDTGKNFEKLNDNWKKFEEQLNDIYKDFEKIIQ